MADEHGEVEDQFEPLPPDQEDTVAKPLAEMTVHDFDWDNIETPDDEEEIVEEDEESNIQEGMELEGGETKVYLPGQELAQEEELVCDRSTYITQTEFTSDWPCLSFDILKDGFGNERTQFPMSMYIVAGTQADQPNKNKLNVLKLANIKRQAEEDEDDEEEDDTIGGEDEPLLTHRGVPHRGGVNRVRACGTVVASWADTKKVHIWDLSTHFEALDNPNFVSKNALPSKPLFTFAGHQDEGFALDWSPVVPLRLASGDCTGAVHLWTSHEGGTWSVGQEMCLGHEASVEDLQWSPNEPDVLASCSVDKTIRIWDTRHPQQAAVTVPAHQADVNVISWNRLEQYLLVSGSDDGLFCVWDLRTFQDNHVEPLATFKWHSAPITSIEWHPTDPSVIGVAGEDDQVTLWDMAVEEDTEASDERVDGVPPQLLFIHQGQANIKEIHWHPQAPGMMVSTAETGFNVFKTISV
eukprot:m.11822 g.11822  ORF g.11822 m.11822 type:complete len:467 (+) comp7847_c0_seq1:60-1460(+)